MTFKITEIKFWKNFRNKFSKKTLENFENTQRTDYEDTWSVDPWIIIFRIRIRTCTLERTGTIEKNKLKVNILFLYIGHPRFSKTTVSNSEKTLTIIEIFSTFHDFFEFESLRKSLRNASRSLRNASPKSYVMSNNQRSCFWHADYISYTHSFP